MAEPYAATGLVADRLRAAEQSISDAITELAATLGGLTSRTGETRHESLETVVAALSCMTDARGLVLSAHAGLEPKGAAALNDEDVDEESSLVIVDMEDALP